ncbi:hypothetical protein HY469_03075 [Candidatus Roizmanbacteria bacterium]|nr:hypothetical protein [Candidatus Roizmanbacteria bacterium]
MKILLFKIISGFLLWLGIISPSQPNLGAPSSAFIVGTSTFQTIHANGVATTTIGSASTTLAGDLSVIGTARFFGGINASSSATSTFVNGISLDGGCFRVGGSCISSAGDGNFSTTSADWWFNGALSATTTTGLAEGANLYYTNSRDIKFSTTSADYWVGSVLPGTTTTALPEGNNLYWTNTRFDNRLSASSSISGITTLPNLSLPYSQLSGAFAYPFPSNATSSTLTFSGGFLVTASSTFNATLNLEPSVVTQHQDLGFRIATSTTASTSKMYVWNTNKSETWKSVTCRTDNNIVDVQLYNGTNLMNMVRASGTVAQFALTTNNAISKGGFVDVIASSSASQQTLCTVDRIVN